MSYVLIAFMLGLFTRRIWNRFRRSELWTVIVVYRLWPKCEYCGTIWGLELEASRTMYSVDYYSPTYHVRNDPNRSRFLCRCCAQQHHEYWDEMWSDYYGGRL